jgi:hypothetical protein
MPIAKPRVSASIIAAIPLVCRARPILPLAWKQAPRRV